MGTLKIFGDGLAGVTALKALVVDDDKLVLSLLERILSCMGVSVAVEATIHGVLDRILTVRPHLVLLDLHMPDLDGPSLVQRVRAHPEIGPTTILLHSALEEEDLERRAIEYAADGYLCKCSGLLQLEQDLAALVGR
jgi:CheY-like chemotaxis protein